MAEQTMLRGWWVHKTHRLTATSRDRSKSTRGATRKDSWTSANKEKLYGIAKEKLDHEVYWELELTDRFTGRREFLRADSIDQYRAEYLAEAYAAA